MTNGSGDYVIAFSTRRMVGSADSRIVPSAYPRPSGSPLGPIRLSDTIEVATNDAMSPLFEAVIEATEEAIYNSMLRAETVRGFRGTVAGLPIDSTVAILRRYGVIRD